MVHTAVWSLRPNRNVFSDCLKQVLHDRYDERWRTCEGRGSLDIITEIAEDKKNKIGLTV